MRSDVFGESTVQSTEELDQARVKEALEREKRLQRQEAQAQGHGDRKRKYNAGESSEVTREDMEVRHTQT
jgi:hypothetical protein